MRHDAPYPCVCGCVVGVGVWLFAAVGFAACGWCVVSAAEELRSAAALMRERATEAQEKAPTQTDADVSGVWLGSRYHLAWHPLVALAVADWLELAASHANWRHYIGDGPTADMVDAATAIAHAYLGGVR